MKPNELRIGNWAFEKYNDQMKPFRVLGIKYRLFENSGNHFIQVNAIQNTAISLICPIPLTEEILINAGFELYSNTYWRKKRCPFYLTVFKTITAIQISFVCDQGSIEIGFVHQLQNLYFALTGEEIEIKL
jgi:hypothetical protein